MENLISKEKVLQLAFADGEYISPEAIADYDIAAATDRYIMPIVGTELMEAMQAGRYTSLVDEYVAPALAMSVRTMIQAALNVRTGQCGLSIASSYRSDTSTKSAIVALNISLAKRRKTLLRRLSNHLKNNASLYPEYSVQGDALQKCSLDGGLVQVY